MSKKPLIHGVLLKATQLHAQKTTVQRGFLGVGVERFGIPPYFTL